MERLKQDNLTM